jgi:hypothetical protein
MQALFAIVTMILVLTSPGQRETPKGGTTFVTASSAHMPSVNGLPRLPQLPRLPPLPRVPRVPRF